jgi:hypothetical protein
MTRRRINVPLGVFGALCISVSAMLLAGARDWDWLAHSYVAPLIFIGLGTIVLSATLWPDRMATGDAVGSPAPAHAAHAADAGGATGPPRPFPARAR